jgi:hypothetical protein
MANVLCPAVAPSVDLGPFVEELWRTEYVNQAVERLTYLCCRASAEITDYDRGAVNEWESPLIEVVAITRDQHAAEAESLRRMVLVWVASAVSVTDAQHVRSYPFEHSDGALGEILVSVKSRLSLATEIIDNLTLLSLTWLAIYGDIGPRHFGA